MVVSFGKIICNDVLKSKCNFSEIKLKNNLYLIIKILIFNVKKAIFIFALIFLFIANSCTKMETVVEPTSAKFPVFTANSIVRMDSSLVIQNDSNITIDGQNSTLVFTHWSSHIFIINSHNITIKNLNIEYDPIPYSQGIITKRNGNTITVKQVLGIPFDSSFYNQSLTLYGIFRTANFELIPNISNVIPIAQATTTKISNGVYDITIYNLPAAIDTGHYFIKDPSSFFQSVAAVQGSYSDNVVLSNVNVYNSPNVAFNMFLCANTTIDKCSVIPKPNSGRALSSNRDGINITTAGGLYAIGPFITNNTIQDCGDDGINIHKHSIVYDTITHDYLLYTLLNKNFNNSLIRSVGSIGDSLVLFDKTGTIVNTPKPIIISNITTSDSIHYKFGFLYPLNTLPEATNIIVNFSQKASSSGWSLVSNNTVIRSRRIGILILEPRSIVKNNTVTQQPSSGIYISNMNIQGPNNTSLCSPCISIEDGNIVSKTNIQLNGGITINQPIYTFLQCPK